MEAAGPSRRRPSSWSGTSQPQKLCLYACKRPGAATISVSNNGGGLTDPAPVSYTVQGQVEATTVKDGNWSDPTVWNTGVVPGAGDVAVIDNNITITSDTTIGDGSDSTVLDATNGTLTVLGATLTIRGNATFGRYTGGTLVTVLTVQTVGTCPGRRRASTVMWASRPSSRSPTTPAS